MGEVSLSGKPAAAPGPAWIRWVLIVLVIEKIVQHAVVTLAFYFNWGEIARSVAVSPSVLMILGAFVAILFVVSLWGLIARRGWSTRMISGLALLDIIGEIVAQGTFFVAITVSFVVALVLLALSLRHDPMAAPPSN